MSSVTWKDLAELIQRLARLEERLQGLNDELSSVRDNLKKLEASQSALAMQISEIRDVLLSNAHFYRKMLYRIIITVVAAVATAISTLLVRLFG